MANTAKGVVWGCGGVVMLLLGLLGAGAFLPREHRATRRLTLKASPAQVWALVSDLRRAQWRSQVQEVVVLPSRHGHEVVEERYMNGEHMAFEVLEREEGRKLVRRIVDQDQFGGTWTLEVQALPEGRGTGCNLTITEDGWVGLPFRFLSRFVFGQSAVMEAYLREVAGHFGEAVAVERVP